VRSSVAERVETRGEMRIYVARPALPQAEHSDANPASGGICQNCGHPADEHSIDNDTCRHVNQPNGVVKLCNCERWIHEETAEATASLVRMIPDKDAL
jgi:hypothetical protein